MVPAFPSLPGYDDSLGLGGWSAGNDGGSKDDRRQRSRGTPDLCRLATSSAGEGPPRSAPPWVDLPDGRQTPVSPGEGRTLLQPRSTIVEDVWQGVNRDGGDAISKATYMRVHLEIHGRMREADSTSGQLAAATTTPDDMHDLRSLAETNWAANSKGRATMDFEQFEQALSGIMERFGVVSDGFVRDSERCEAVYSAVRQAFCAGGAQSVDHDTYRRNGGFLSPTGGPPGTPLRGSFPDGFVQQVAPGTGSRRSLLMSARLMHKDGTRTENSSAVEGFPCEKALQRNGKNSAGSDKRRKYDDDKAVGCGQAALQSHSCVSWPPAWVKLRKHGNEASPNSSRCCGSDQSERLVLARGYFDTSSGARHQQQKEVNFEARRKALPVDARGLKGSSSQKALWLQQELRHDRVRLYELQRQGVRGLTGPALLPPNIPTTTTTATDDSHLAGTGASGSTNYRGAAAEPRVMMPESLLCLAGVGSLSMDCLFSNNSEQNRVTSSERQNRAGSLEPSLESSLESSLGSRSGSGSSVTRGEGEWGRRNHHASVSKNPHSRSVRTDFAHGKSREATSTVAPAKRLILPCRACRLRESALWCVECTASYCLPCFETIPHHRGTGLMPDASLAAPYQASSEFQATTASAANGAPGSLERDRSAEATTHMRGPQLPRSLCLGRPKAAATTFASEEPLGAEPPPQLEMEGSKTGSWRGRRKSRRYSSSMPLDQVRKVTVLRQDELAAFRSIPALCLNSGADGVCSARDFHNNKYALAAAKAVSPRGLHLTVPVNQRVYSDTNIEKCLLQRGVGSSKKANGVSKSIGPERGASGGLAAGQCNERGEGVVKNFGGISVRVVAS